MARRRFARLMPFVGAAVALAACNALTGLSDDYHLAGDSGVTPGNETSTPVEGGDNDTGVDAGMDTSKADSDQPAPSDPICPVVKMEAGAEVMYCNDFEQTGADSGGFTSFSAASVGTGTLDILAGAGYGATGGLVAQLSRPMGGGGSQLWGQFNLPPSGFATDFSHYDVWLKIKIAEKPSGPDYVILSLLTFEGDGTGSGDHGVALYSESALRRTKVNNMFPDGGIGATIPSDDWVDVLFAVDKVVGTTYNRSMSIAGNPQPEVQFNMSSTWTPVVRVGTFYTSSNAGDAKVQFDRLVIRRRQ